MRGDDSQRLVIGHGHLPMVWYHAGTPVVQSDGVHVFERHAVAENHACLIESKKSERVESILDALSGGMNRAQCAAKSGVVHMRGSGGSDNDTNDSVRFETFAAESGEEPSLLCETTGVHYPPAVRLLLADVTVDVPLTTC